MATIRQDDLIDSIADALQFISYYHPTDYIRNLAKACEMEQSPAARDAMARIEAPSYPFSANRSRAASRTASRVPLSPVRRPADRLRRRLEGESLTTSGYSTRPQFPTRGIVPYTWRMTGCRERAR